ncbi:MAG: superoxide dismutase [Polyangiaceae bacterium]|nr:superoxide dismutase [Polyangiaceae bacterium]
MEFVVPALPYAKDALEPVMSSETLEFHYEKHHKGYMTKLKAALEGTPDAAKSLEDVVKTSQGGVFNNAAQVWNHTFWWNSLKPNGGGAPPAGELADLVEKYGGWDKLRADIIAKGGAQFGSGWAWLVLADGELKVVTTANAETPITSDVKPLLTIDVWEHAYYLDHRNARPAFLEAVCDKLLNWDFAAANLKA